MNNNNVMISNLMWNFYFKAHAVSVPYAINLFQGTQLFNRELAIKTRSSNSQQKVDTFVPPVQPLQTTTMRNFEPPSNTSGNGFNRLERNREQNSAHGNQSLRSGFNAVPTKASMHMQPQPSKRSSQHQTNPLTLNDLDKLMSLSSNMLQPSSRKPEPQRATFDKVFSDRDRTESSRHSSNLKMTSRHGQRSHYRDPPYSRRDPPRPHHRSGSDRHRRWFSQSLYLK